VRIKVGTLPIISVLAILWPLLFPRITKSWFILVLLGSKFVVDVVGYCKGGRHGNLKPILSCVSVIAFLKCVIDYATSVYLLVKWFGPLFPGTPEILLPLLIR
jgi:hypothetical protein